MLTMEDIVRDGHPALRKKSELVQIPPTLEDQKILNKMLRFLKNSQDETMKEKYQLRTGVGLVAPQIDINKQLLAIYFHYEDKLYSYQLINPKIVSHSVEKAFLANGEGCLSVDEQIDGYVFRHARVTIKAFDINGNQVKLRFKGYPAIVIQHEIDHLNGIMFYDHINKEHPFHIPEGATIIE